jgi:hypothetical protein
MRNKPKLSPARQARDREIYARYLRGATERELKQEFRTTDEMVRRAIKAGNREAAKEFANTDSLRVRNSKQLLDIYTEAMAAWEESKKGAEVTKVSTGPGGDDGRRKAEKTTHKEAGDPRFLAQAMDALEDLRKLWRLELPDPGRDEDMHNHQPLTVEEDARWYGNDAHDLASQTPAAPTADPPLPGEVQGGGVREAMG